MKMHCITVAVYQHDCGPLRDKYKAAMSKKALDSNLNGYFIALVGLIIFRKIKIVGD